MTVQQLREMILSLQPVFDSAGAAKTARDLADFAAGLGEFDGRMTLPAFFKLAKEGQKPPKPPKEPKPAKAPKPNADEVASEVASLHERPRDPAVTAEVISATLEKLKPMTKPDVVKVASAVGLTAVAKLSKDKVVEAIRGRIQERRDAALKNDMIGGVDRSVASAPEPLPAGVA